MTTISFHLPSFICAPLETLRAKLKPEKALDERSAIQRPNHSATIEEQRRYANAAGRGTRLRLSRFFKTNGRKQPEKSADIGTPHGPPAAQASADMTITMPVMRKNDSPSPQAAASFSAQMGRQPSQQRANPAGAIERGRETL